MILSERENSILDILVRDYIRHARPVSSEYISQKLDHELSPASVRNTLSDLSSRGYLKQPHTSAGRSPTQKAYRFFVDSVFEKEYEENISLETALERLVEELHVVSGVLGRGFEMGPWGFRELFTEPEFKTTKMVVQFGSFFDSLQNDKEQYGDNLEENGFNIFIGKENPVCRAANISIALRMLEDDYMLFAAGPLRMDYEKIINIFKSI
ncbi:hypothetical protein ACFL3E_02075 [Patescibacteria group bacterium]